MIVTSLCGCEDCDSWRISTATGYLITSDGVIVTCYHVVDKPRAKAIGAMTFDGKVFAVVEVLAADEAADFAILRLEASPEARPLPLRCELAPIGSPVSVIGHPDGQFFTFTQGHVSRYALGVPEGRDRTAASPSRSQWMLITADFGRGSSGGPVLDPTGSVAGMVSRTHSVYSDAGNAAAGHLQMVIRFCVPVTTILGAIESPSRRAQSTVPARQRRLQAG